MSSSPDTQAKAHRAAVKFRRMLPTLTSYARNISGNKRLRIQVVADGARTDGQVIYLSPPIGLGDSAPHVKELCDKRDPSDLLMRCLACRAHEEVMVNLYHEIAHNAFGSFVKIDSHTLQQEAKKALENADSNFAKAALAKVESHGGYISYGSATHYISPHLAALANVLDDVRINQRMFEARPGMAKMFIADETRLATEGISVTDPRTGALKVTHYNEMPRDAQVCIAAYFTGAGYSVEGVFIDEVVEAVQDEELSRLLEQAAPALGMKDVFGLSIKVLLRLRELGFLKMINDPDEETPEESESGSGASDDDTDQPDDADSQPQDDAPSAEAGDDDPQDGDDAPAPENPIPGRESDDETEGSGEPDDDEQEDSDDDGHASGDESTQEDGDNHDQTGGDGEDNSDQNDDGVSEDGSRGNDSPESGQTTSESDSDSGIESEPDPKPEHSDPNEVAKLVQIALGHQSDDGAPEMSSREEREINSAMKIAVNQAHNFEAPATGVSGVLVHENSAMKEKAWGNLYYSKLEPYELKPPEAVMGPALLKTRVTFSANKRAHYQGDLKAGKVNPRVLGKRAHLGDDRLFRRKQIPGKRDYFVLIGVDISGSTSSLGIRDIILKAAFAQAELLHRTGVNFAIYAHSGGAPGYGSELPEDSYALEIFQVKGPDQQWDKDAKERLGKLVPYSANVDGHTLEFYRKVLDSRRETDRIIMYYTDGAMPHYNFREELEVLQREIKTCRQKDYTLMAVGVCTDSPVEHGLDTIQIDTEEDIAKVVKHLDKRLIRKS